MALEYTIVYRAENVYDHPVKEARWQFLITPDENSNQKLQAITFKNSMDFPYEFSTNAYGFKTIRIRAKAPFEKIFFEASFKLIKESNNPFDFIMTLSQKEEYSNYQQLQFKVDHEPFLRRTPLTSLLEHHNKFFSYQPDKFVFENLLALNKWVFEKIFYTPGATNVDTTLDEIIEHRQGVCQDFAHLFCAVARKYGIPARYVSGYLHQGNGYFGDSQMHAWSEAFIEDVGWVGFDPTNNLIANENHIKVAHGKDYTDCSPLKGVLYSRGSNTTNHNVQVHGQQQQQ